MTGIQKSNQVQGTDRLEDAARDLAASTRDIARPSDSKGILEGLRRSQESLNQTYRQLADWHGRVVEGVHHGGEKDGRADPHNPGWIRAELALQEAAQYGADAVAALTRAENANEIARWFDEVLDDEL
ncbi:hypothetical protein [Frigoribacterium sp. UYMn621]|uniref:hypothetical protein n=1 Tax=Frigoribacterium sp. UYMn621 TaxID=3156343 RepID=UPI0033938E90